MPTTDQYRRQALEAAAHRAGLKDAALLAIAKADLTPHAAVADLRKRFPAAFPHVSAMNAEQADEFERSITTKGWSIRR